MPEGPETLIQAQQLESVLVNKKLTQVFFYHADPDSYRKKLEASKVKSIVPHGKSLLLNFSNGLSIYTHNNLYGKWKVLSRDEALEKNPIGSLRLSLSTKTDHACLFSASDIQVVPTKEVTKIDYIRSLGPSCLDKQLTEKKIVGTLSQAKLQKRKVKSLLLDQKVIAGIGNYLRNEILFFAKIHPERTLGSLNKNSMQNLAHAIREIPKRSYESGGFTRAPAEIGDLSGVSQSEKLRFYVYGRMNLPCYRCKGKILRISDSAQPLYVCKNCQTEQS